MQVTKGTPGACERPLPQPPAPQAHQIERGTGGNHGEYRRGRRDLARAVRPGQRPNDPPVIAASQAEGSGTVVVCRPEGLSHVASVVDREHAPRTAQ